MYPILQWYYFADFITQQTSSVYNTKRKQTFTTTIMMMIIIITVTYVYITTDLLLLSIFIARLVKKVNNAVAFPFPLTLSAHFQLAAWLAFYM